MSEGEVDEKRDMHEDDETEHEIEHEDDDLPFLSIQDIEILMRNTEIWDKLLQGKINIDEARREFEVNGRVFDGIENRKKAKKQASRKKATRKRATKKAKNEENEEEVKEVEPKEDHEVEEE